MSVRARGSRVNTTSDYRANASELAPGGGSAQPCFVVEGLARRPGRSPARPRLRLHGRAHLESVLELSVSFGLTRALVPLRARDTSIPRVVATVAAEPASTSRSSVGAPSLPPVEGVLERRVHKPFVTALIVEPLQERQEELIELTVSVPLMTEQRRCCG
jgi:hypothetical protein